MAVLIVLVLVMLILALAGNAFWQTYRNNPSPAEWEQRQRLYTAQREVNSVLADAERQMERAARRRPKQADWQNW